MDRKTKKALTDLFKRMLEEDLGTGKYGDLTPDGDGYKHTEYSITITKTERKV